MKKVLLIVLFVIAMDAWGQSSWTTWTYDRQWTGMIRYEGSGRAKYDDIADLHNNYSKGRFQGIEHPSNKQKDLITYGLDQYSVRTNDVYTVAIGDLILKHTYVALVIITSLTSDGGYRYSYYLWEDLNQRGR
ncbi:MAG: hypothetical protein LBI03_08640 [Clostridiales bacterium]|jgi:hypothetical protein|nr:hypothetical protein [Clostridiales bacterium]